MDEYRSLTEEEIQILEKQGCIAEDWTAINVADDFSPLYLKNVEFSGEIYLGVFEKNITFEDGFSRHSGIRHAILRDVTVGDNCLIENIGGYIYNYTIGEDSILVNIGKINTSTEYTFGRGNIISVINESDNGNTILFEGLTSNIAALMVKHADDKEFKSSMWKLVRNVIQSNTPERGEIGYGVKITNTLEITNSIIMDHCEVNGASRICETTLFTYPMDADSGIFIGNDVILENSIVVANASIMDGAKINNCFVGEACHIGKGASADNSLFFANSYLDNGESCAAFCGPFTVSHHKSTLLISGQYSFYNAGSNTNYSNHAYKMGPIHWGIIERGSKTASGTHILWPAQIGSFSMCMGKIQNHPCTLDLPFSYIFGSNDSTYLAPGRNITTVGTYRDISKWPKRDMRVRSGKNSIINFDWLNPTTIQECCRGKKVLEDLRTEQGEHMASYIYKGCNIRNKSLEKGIKYYDLAIRLFIGETLQKHLDIDLPSTSIGSGEWNDLAGLILPEEKELELIDNIKNGCITSYSELQEEMQNIHAHYEEYKWAWALRIILSFYHLDTIGQEDIIHIQQDYQQALNEWNNAIKYDAENEFKMGDVAIETLNDFLNKQKY